MSDDKKPEETRKLSEEEMEAAKGGATFAKLSTFNVSSNFAKQGAAVGPAGATHADTAMCGGQTRSMTNQTNQTNVQRGG